MSKQQVWMLAFQRRVLQAQRCMACSSCDHGAVWLGIQHRAMTGGRWFDQLAVPRGRQRASTKQISKVGMARPASSLISGMQW